jgi:hypothetical protein
LEKQTSEQTPRFASSRQKGSRPSAFVGSMVRFGVAIGRSSRRT